jgi:20S proteasome alpha/beta subunit
MSSLTIAPPIHRPEPQKKPFDFRNKPPYPPRPTPKKILEPWRLDVTLCIAATSRQFEAGEAIVLCCDERVETYITSADIEIKIAEIKELNWYAMFAGEVSKARELLYHYRSALQLIDLRENTQQKFQEVAWSYRKSLMEHYVRMQFGISYQEFLERGTDLPAEVFASAIHDMGQIDFGCELILAGFVDSAPQLFHLDRYTGKVSPESHFLAIGTGGTNACSMLYYRNQNKQTGIDASIYHVYEAKRFGERAPGVGSSRVLFVLNPSGIKIFTDQKQLEALYNSLSPQSTSNLKLEFRPHTLLGTRLLP